MARAVAMTRVEVEETPGVAPRAASRAGADRPDAFPAEGGSGRAAGPGRHGGRWIAVAAVVVAALAGTQAAVDAHERTVDARLARIAGAVQRVDAAPSVVWRSDGLGAVVIGQRVVAAGLAVGILTSRDGSRDVVGYDLADGRRRWAVQMDGPDALRARTEAPRATAACAVVPPPASSRGGTPSAPEQVACVTTDQVAAFSDGQLFVTRPARHGHLVVLDAATGRRVVDRPTSPTPAFVVLPGLVVLAEAGADARTHVVGEDLVTGDVRWRYRSAVPSVIATGEPFLRLVVVGRQVVLVDGSGTATVLSSTGAARRPTTRPLLGWSVDASGGVWLETGAAPGSGGSDPATVVVRPRGGEVVLPGRGVAPLVDDGSLPDLVVSSAAGRTTGADASTGARRWVSSLQAEPPGSLVLGGRVVVVTPRGVAALDGRDGSTDWVARADAGGVVTALASDGRRVLAVEEGGGDAVLVALRASDGRVEWRAPLLPGDLRVLARDLVVVGPGYAARVAP
ncbi:outer membrane protein assembly factor BamB family protein [Cellulomonas alba]|uniref:PQQ-binding-like beta-propeller repeat protein n=1 Tax=Cellulomonas alba TaxID=3053467 RepID=A0ABT7SE96_9CELL|nr:PQQ-binding-like beta-propeller repeat protein [Cellulomonas alba]MDM7854510.1 PQQ-binding-like beta-propeller repeat protein [Cellulomonas alba]